VTVEQALVGVQGTEPVLGPPKSAAAHRVVVLPEQTVELLERHLAEYTAAGRRCALLRQRLQRVIVGHGPRAAVCTATAEIWRLIHHIDLDTNKASIFYAITTKTHRLLLPTPRRIGAIHRHTSAVDDLEDAADQTPLIYRSTQLTDFEAVEWELVTTQLVDPIAEIVIDECSWNRHTRHFGPRADRLRASVAWRLAETSTGERSGVQTVAAALGDAPDNIKCTQADLNRAMRQPGRYEQLLDAPSPREVTSIRREVAADQGPLLPERRAA
jgi:hypothetical protein